MLTANQLTVLNDARLRAYPYPGMRDTALPTSIWFHDFIKPAAHDPTLRLVAESTKMSATLLGVAEDIAVIVRGNPDAPNSEGCKGAGILHCVRIGMIPPRPVITDTYFRTGMVPVEYDEPSANSIRKEMRYDGWVTVTEDLLRRGIIRLTPGIKMLLGRNGHGA